MLESTGKAPIGVRRVDINRGDEARTEYRSRLDALQLLLSMAMTEGIGYRNGKEQQSMKLELIDFNRAYLQAPARRTIYVQLPEEDASPGMCAKLVKAMY